MPRRPNHQHFAVSGAIGGASELWVNHLSPRSSEYVGDPEAARKAAEGTAQEMEACATSEAAAAVATATETAEDADDAGVEVHMNIAAEVATTRGHDDADIATASSRTCKDTAVEPSSEADAAATPGAPALAVMGVAAGVEDILAFLDEAALDVGLEPGV